MEAVMMDVMFTIPSDDTIAKCIITEDSVEGNAHPQIEYRTERIADKSIS